MKGSVFISASYMISPLGEGVKENFDAMRRGRIGIHRHEPGPKTGIPVFAGLIAPSVYDSLREKYAPEDGSLTDAELLAVACIDRMEDRDGHKVSLPAGTALVIASAKGNVSLLEGRCRDGKFTPADTDRVLFGSMSSRISARFGIDAGDTYVISNACISGVSALAAARRMILSGQYDHVAVVGVDTQNRFIISGFASFKSLSPEICRPYDSARQGLNLGEACGAVLLSREGGRGQVHIDGGAASDDANHISGPSRTGDGLYFAMRAAMSEAGVSADDVDMLQMHGTATVYNDEMESKAAGLAGLSEVPLQSLKPYFGHTMGASGVIETIIAAEELKSGIFLGTRGFENPGVPVPLNVSAHERHLVSPKFFLKTASGFGGTNAAVLLSVAEPRKEDSHHMPPVLRKARAVRISDGRINADGTEVFSASSSSFHTFSREAYKALGENNMKFYKMDDLCKLAYLASAWLLDGTAFGEEECGIILSGKYGCLDTDMRHQQIIDTEGDESASPAVFVYTLPNVAAGEISIRHHIKGENIWFCSADRTLADIRKYAGLASSAGKWKYCIAGNLDFINGEYFANFELLEAAVTCSAGTSEK